MRSARECRWTDFRCYFPTVVAAVFLGAVIAYGIFVMQERELARIRMRHVLNGVVLWFVMGPVMVGFCRGMRRHRRHLTQPAPRTRPAPVTMGRRTAPDGPRR